METARIRILVNVITRLIRTRVNTLQIRNMGVIVF